MRKLSTFVLSAATAATLVGATLAVTATPAAAEGYRPYERHARFEHRRFEHHRAFVRHRYEHRR
jgi:hypothetical protein